MYQPPVPGSSSYLPTFSQESPYSPFTCDHRRCLASDPPFPKEEFSQRERGIRRHPECVLQVSLVGLCQNLRAKDSAGGCGPDFLPTHILFWLRQAASSWEKHRPLSVSIIRPRHPYGKGDTELDSRTPVLLWTRTRISPLGPDFASGALRASLEL